MLWHVTAVFSTFMVNISFCTNKCFILLYHNFTIVTVCKIYTLKQKIFHVVSHNNQK